MSDAEPNLDDIERAADRIKKYIRPTPLIHSDHLSLRFNTNIYLKLESLQYTGSYKTRGAANKIESLKERKSLDRGLITASAGNHAQGLARAAFICGKHQFTEIVMALDSKPFKQTATERWGVVLTKYGHGFDEANAFARERAKNTGKTMVEAFDDYDVIAGQGTVGLEIVEELPQVSAVVCPVGGGGLISGLAIVGTQHKRRFPVFGVQAAECQSMVHALKTGHPEKIGEFQKTIMDGIAVKKAGEKTFGLVKKYVGEDHVGTVWESDTRNAMARLAHYEHLIVEGAGAVPVAALEKVSKPHKPRKQLIFSPDDHVVLVVSGGNISWPDFRQATQPVRDIQG